MTRVLLTGANGFIGRHITARLISAGFQVRAAVRAVDEMRRTFPGVEVVYADLNRDTEPAHWIPRLKDVDAVVNCAGILQGSRRQSIEAIHHKGPKALFDACVDCGIRRVIQISAISTGAETAYARTKKQADEHLMGLDLDWVVLRPSLVYAEGSYGGTSLFRALAVFPIVIPLVGKGDQAFQPIHMDDLTETIVRLLADSEISREVIAPVGPETLTLKEVLHRLRGWLGFPQAPTLPVSKKVIQIAARLGDWIGRGSLNTTALEQLEFGNVAPVQPFTKITGIQPRSMAQAFAARPSHVQDRWHARLYFLRPLLRWSLGLMWIASGIVGFFSSSQMADSVSIWLGLPSSTSSLLVAVTCGLDILIGLALWIRGLPSLIGPIQVIVILGYTALLTLALPELWIDPFGPLLKNIPILFAVLTLHAIEIDR